MAWFFRSVVRSVKLAAIFLYGALELILKHPTTREQQAEWLHQLCSRALRQMNVTLRCDGAFPERGVVISNHIGYLDIVAFAALHPCSFVAKAEMRRWPILGWMTTTVGTVYVDRGRGGSALRAATGMRAAAAAGVPVVFFPEGTTSNGACVLKFHSGLLMQSLEAQQPITAAFVRYRLTQDNRPGITVENTVSYWDNTPLLVHIFRVLALRGIEIDVRIADAPIEFSPGLRRRLVAAEARAAVVELGDARDAVTAD